MSITRGTVLSVSDELVGDYLSADASAAATTLYVDDLSDFSQGGGVAFLDDDTTSPEYVTYTAIDSTLDTITLSTALVYAHAAGTPVIIQPQSSNRWARIQSANPDIEPIIARVPFSMRDKLQTGLRSAIDGADDLTDDIIYPEEVQFDFDGRDWSISDVLRRDVTDSTFASKGWHLPKKEQLRAASTYAIGNLIAPTWRSTPVAKNLLVALLVWRGTATFTSWDTSWTQHGSTLTNGTTTNKTNLMVFLKESDGTDDRPTLTVSASSDIAIITGEFSNARATADQATSNTGTSTTPSSGTTSATTEYTELALAFFGQSWDAGSLNPFDEDTLSNGFDGRAELSAAPTNSTAAMMAYKVITTVGTQSTDFTDASNKAWVGKIVTLEARGRPGRSPGSADPDSVAVYAKPHGPASSLFFKNERGTEFDLSAPGMLSIIEDVTPPANKDREVIGIDLDANYLLPGTTFRFNFAGVLTSDSIPGTSTWKLYCQGVVVATMTAAITASSGNAGVSGEGVVTVRSVGAAGSAIGQIYATARTAFSGYTVRMSNESSAATIDTTVAGRLKLTFNSGDAGCTLTFTNCIIILENY